MVATTSGGRGGGGERDEEMKFPEKGQNIFI